MRKGRLPRARMMRLAPHYPIGPETELVDACRRYLRAERQDAEGDDQSHRRNLFWMLLLRASRKAAQHARRQTAQALEIPLHNFSPPLDEISQEMASEVFAKAEEKKASPFLEALRGIAASIALIFGRAFSRMLVSAQRWAGVQQEMWLTMRDDRVRPAHRAMDGVYYLVGQKPLPASMSSNGEDCAPGDDFSCRCVPVPVPP